MSSSTNPGQAAKRGHCLCGDVSFEYEIHLHAASLEDPAGFVPTFHVRWSEKLPRIHVADDLPKYPHGGQG